MDKSKRSKRRLRGKQRRFNKLYVEWLLMGIFNPALKEKFIKRYKFNPNEYFLTTLPDWMKRYTR